MKSIDTNILVRYYAQNDTLQSPLALSIFREEPELFVTFDDRKFAHRAQRLNLVPICEIPA